MSDSSCQICQQAPFKYKCSTCALVKFCSVQCYKHHQAEGCARTDLAAKQVVNDSSILQGSSMLSQDQVELLGQGWSLYLLTNIHLCQNLPRSSNELYQT